MTKQVAYRRVSTVNNGQSVDRQLYNLGITFDLEFEDHSSGSKRAGRPQLTECLACLEKGDTLFIHSIDRLARNTKDLLNITQDLIDRGIGVRFVKEGLNVGSETDPMASAMGAMLLSVLGAIHTFQLTMIQTSVKEGLKVAVANGKKLGAASPIYKENKRLGKHKAHVSSGNQTAAKARVEPLRATLVSAIASHRSATKTAPTLRQVCSVLNSMNIPTPSGVEGSQWVASQASRVIKRLEINL